MGGKVWMRQMLASAFLLPAVVCGTAFAINFIAIYYHASRAIPFGTMVSSLLIGIGQPFELGKSDGINEKMNFINNRKSSQQLKKKTRWPFFLNR